MVIRLLTTASLLVLMACASGGSQPGTARRNRNLITAEEVAASSATTAGDLIQQLRPNWLRGRGPVSMSRGTPDFPVIYVDEIRSSDPEVLIRVSSQIILEMRFMPARDATTMFGLDHAGGAIMIKTKRGGTR